MFEYIKENCEYFVSPWGFLIGFAIAPLWLHTVIQNIIGIIAALITVVLTYFLKKELERRFPNGIEFMIVFKKRRKK